MLTQEMNRTLNLAGIEKVSVMSESSQREDLKDGYCIKNKKDFMKVQSYLIDGLGFLAVCEKEGLDDTHIYSERDIICQTDPYMVSTSYAMVCWQILACDRMNRYLKVSKADLAHPGPIVGEIAIDPISQLWSKKVVCRLSTNEAKQQELDPAKNMLNKMLGEIEQEISGRFEIDYVDEPGFWNVVDRFLIIPESALLDGYWGDLTAELDNVNRLVFIPFDSV